MALRRSDRTCVQRSRTCLCDDCGLFQATWCSLDLTPGRCPGCNRFNNDLDRLLVARNNNHAHQVGQMRKCVCPCQCPDTDDLTDADYETDNESEDEPHDSLLLTSAHEEQIARRFGRCTNVVLDADTAAERQLFLESAGHAALARLHDLGRPDESSLCNSDNVTGRSEVSNLERLLDPWDAEALHLSTGQTYFELIDTFPEIVYMQLPQPQHTPPTTPRCNQCERPHNHVFARLLAQDSLVKCEICLLYKKIEDRIDPAGNLLTEPGSQTFNPSHGDDLDHCRCRCDDDHEDMWSSDEEDDALTQMDGLNLSFRSCTNSQRPAWTDLVDMRYVSTIPSYSLPASPAHSMNRDPSASSFRVSPDDSAPAASHLSPGTDGLLSSMSRAIRRAEVAFESSSIPATPTGPIRARYHHTIDAADLSERSTSVFGGFDLDSLTEAELTQFVWRHRDQILANHDTVNIVPADSNKSPDDQSDISFASYTPLYMNENSSGFGDRRNYPISRSVTTPILFSARKKISPRQRLVHNLHTPTGATRHMQLAICS